MLPVHGGHVPAVGVCGGFHGVDGQHLLPRRLGAGDLQGVEGAFLLQLLQPLLVRQVDLHNGGVDGLTGAGILPGKENAEAGTKQESHQAEYHHRQQHTPAPCQKGCPQRPGPGHGSFRGSGGNLCGPLGCMGGRAGSGTNHAGLALKGRDCSFPLSHRPLAGLDAGQGGLPGGWKGGRRRFQPPHFGRGGVSPAGCALKGRGRALPGARPRVTAPGKRTAFPPGSHSGGGTRRCDTLC